ncbi:cell wall hydrolase [Sphingomonas sp. NY01]|uniref:cell wall hydrolase n=1 Tax=Sphingomonas sp. NY01 TaxID=2968057 RepID=UPI00315DBA25
MRHRHLPSLARAGVLLAAATSCVPQPRAARDAAAAPAPLAAQPLLRELALDVPADAVAPEAAALPAAALAPAPPFVAQAASADDAARAADCLTAAVYYEARSEPVDGQRAVAQVVLNRVRDRAFPRSVCGVVYQRSSRGCQFSFVCDGSMDRRREPGAWARAEAVARGALAGLVYDPVGSATFYHTSAILPWWAPSLSRIGTVGAHIFYRWRGGMERALAFRQSYAGVEPGSTPPLLTPAAESRIATVLAEEVERTGGVTIHRGGQTLVAQGKAPVQQSGGVRIHRGVPAPAGMQDAGAVIGEEESPT